jgi:site-specific recombinase XerD
MPKKLLDQLRDAIRIKHYSYSTEKTYVHWAKRYILFHNKRHPAEMGTPEIEAFLAYLAQERHVAASTQNQALSALLFLYKKCIATRCRSASKCGSCRANGNRIPFGTCDHLRVRAYPRAGVSPPPIKCSE